MARGPQGLVQWPGLTGILSADMTFLQGVTPSVCTIVVPAGSIPQEYGTLSFTYGGTTIEFPDCKMVDCRLQRTNMQLLTVVIWDRRWKWTWGGVNGVFNTRLARGDINKDRQRSTHDLAKACFAEMGETDYDLSKMPSLVYPEVNWDRDNPARMLADLADYLGCRVVLGLDNIVRVLPNGDGEQLPDGHFVELSEIYDPPEKPLDMKVVGGPNRYQMDFGLWAVGEDLDGSVKRINDLSYKPAKGWAFEEPQGMWNVFDQFGPKAQELARRTVFRWYRICGNADKSQPIFIPGYGPLVDGWQIVPIEGEQALTWNDVGVQNPAGNNADKNPNMENLPAMVWGSFYRGNLKFNNEPKNLGKIGAGDTTYYGEFRVIRDQGIVEFSDYVFRFRDGKPGTIEEADLVLTCACSVRHPDTRAWVRYEKSRKLGNVLTPTRILKHDEIVVSYVAGAPLNHKQADDDAEKYLDLAEAEYQHKRPQQRKYSGLIKISPDGAIQQVAWHVGPPYAHTTASRNNEFSLTIASYEERRLQQRLNRTAVDEIAAASRKFRSFGLNHSPWEPLK